MKRVILVNQYVTHLFVDIANTFVARGHTVFLLTGGIHSGLERLHPSVKIVYLKQYKRGTSFQRLWSWSVFSLQTYLHFLLQKGYYIFSSNPPLLSLLFWVLRIPRRPYSVIIYDLYPDALVHMGVLQKRGVLANMWHRSNARFFSKADTIIGITQLIISGITRQLDKNQHQKVKSIPVWGDTHNIEPIEKTENPFIEKHQLNKCFVVLYSGNFGSTHSMEEIISAAEILSNETDVKFVLIGDGAQKKAIEKTIREKVLTNIFVLPWQPEDQLKYSFSSADVGLVTLAKGAEQFSIPSKTFSYFAAGVPVIAIAEKESELAHVLTSNGCGIQVDLGNALKLAESILALKGDIRQQLDLKEKALEASKKYCDKNAEEVYHFIKRQVL